MHSRFPANSPAVVGYGQRNAYLGTVVYPVGGVHGNMQTDTRRQREGTTLIVQCIPELDIGGPEMVVPLEITEGNYPRDIGTPTMHPLLALDLEQKIVIIVHVKGSNTVRRGDKDVANGHMHARQAPRANVFYLADAPIEQIAILGCNSTWSNCTRDWQVSIRSKVSSMDSPLG